MFVAHLHPSLVGHVDSRSVFSIYRAQICLFLDGRPEAKALLVFNKVVRLDALTVKNGGGSRHKHSLVDLCSATLV